MSHEQADDGRILFGLTKTTVTPSFLQTRLNVLCLEKILVDLLTFNSLGTGDAKSKCFYVEYIS